MQGRNININTILIDLCMKLQTKNAIQTSAPHANWLQIIYTTKCYTYGHNFKIMYSNWHCLTNFLHNRTNKLYILFWICVSKLVFKFYFLNILLLVQSYAMKKQKKKSEKMLLVTFYLFQYSKHNLFITKYSDSIFFFRSLRLSL